MSTAKKVAKKVKSKVSKAVQRAKAKGLPERIEKALEGLLWASFSPKQQEVIRGIAEAFCDELAERLPQ